MDSQGRRLVALMRPPGPRLGGGGRTFAPRLPVDPERARAEHARLAELLEALGARIVMLPSEDDLPDACFVEDPAIVLDEVTLLTRTGAQHRRDEAHRLAPALGALAPFRPLLRMPGPGTLEGGDVLRVGRTLLVGRSARTDAAGAAWLRRVAEAHGYEVREVEVSGALHLKTACGHAGGGLLIVNPDWVDSSALEDWERLEVPAGEPWGANVLEVAGSVVVPSAFAGVRALLEARGRVVRTAVLDELMKAEAGPTCLVLMLPAAL